MCGTKVCTKVKWLVSTMEPQLNKYKDKIHLGGIIHGAQYITHPQNTLDTE